MQSSMERNIILKLYSHLFANKRLEKGIEQLKLEKGLGSY